MSNYEEICLDQLQEAFEIGGSSFTTFFQIYWNDLTIKEKVNLVDYLYLSLRDPSLRINNQLLDTLLLFVDHFITDWSLLESKI